MNAPRKSGGAKWVLFIILGGFGGLICCGIGSAIAIPGFIGYVRESKTAEVESNLRSIYVGAANYYMQEHAGPTGIVSSQFPAYAPRRPAVPSDQKQVTDFSSDPSWVAIGFTPMDPLYYSYEFQPGPDGRSFVARAYGDLDADGVLSTFELHASVDANGEVVREPEIRRFNELE